MEGQELDLVRQLCRAGRSIPANIAEGVNRSNTATETKRFLGMALRSCDEVQVWLSFSGDLQLLGEERVRELKGEYAQIGAMLYRLWQNWQSRNRPGCMIFHLASSIYHLVW